MTKSKLLVGFIILILIVGIAFYFRIKSQKQVASDKLGVIKIGVIAPLTGFSAEHGNAIKNGIELAKEKMNNNNVLLVYEDSACNPKTAVSAFNKLVTQDKVRVIIGLVCSGDVLAIAPLAEKEKILVIAATASNPNITDSGDFIFRIYPSDAKDADLISDYVKENNFKKVSLISINNDYGKYVNDKIKENLKEKIVLDEMFDYQENDFKTILTKAKYSSDSIIFIGYPENTPSFLRQKKELGLTQKIIGSSATFTSELFDIDNELINNFYFSSPDITPMGRQNFVNFYKDKFNKEPAYPAEYGYDNFNILAKALKNNTFQDIDKLKDNLYLTKIIGATGEVSFDKNGDREGSVLRIYRLNDQRNFSCTFNCN